MTRRREGATAPSHWRGSRRTADRPVSWYLRAIRAASIAASKQCAGAFAATIGTGASPWRPNIACRRIRLLGLGGKPGRGATSLDVDDQQRQFQAYGETHGLRFQVDARPARGRHPEGAAERRSERGSRCPRSRPSAWRVRTPNFLCLESSCKMSDAGVIG